MSLKTDSTPAIKQQERILVIKLGALGDLIQATGPFAAIRTYHESAFIILLTRGAYADFMRQSPYFNSVWIDEEPRVWQVYRLLSLRARLLGGMFTRVYDLQTSNRSSFYFWLMKRPQWSGISSSCTYQHVNPARDYMHTLDRQAEQLAVAGIYVIPAPNLSWAQVNDSDDTIRFRMRSPFVLLVAGGAAHRPNKRWPARHYTVLAVRLVQRGYTPVLVGTSQDCSQIKKIKAACQQAIDISGQTSLTDLVKLGQNAVAAVGNDTGPMHLLAASGCPCVVLYGSGSDSALCAPRGIHVVLLRHFDLAELSVTTVETALDRLQKFDSAYSYLLCST